MRCRIDRTARVIAAALFVTWSATASASVIVEQTRYYDSGVPGTGLSADYVSTWDALAAVNPTPGYGQIDVPDWNNVSSLSPAGMDIASLYSVTFYVADAGTWDFRTSIDSGWGGTLLVDGDELQTRDTNMWWSGSWSDPSQYLAGSLDLSVGWHELTAYGLEDCCNGGGNGQFEAPGGSFTNFSYDDGLPEPATVALFGVGVATLAGLRRFARTGAKAARV